MFGVFVFAFSAVVSLWTSVFFYRAWKKNKLPSYWEFSTFFFILGIAFIVLDTPFAVGGFVASVSAELGMFFIVFSFAFVLRAFLRFQGITAISPNIITIVVSVISAIKFFIGMLVPPAPYFADGLLYLNYSVFSAVGHGTLVFLFTLAVGVTLLSNVKNIQKHKNSILFLGLAFLIGGLSAIFIPAFHTFTPVFFGYTLLLITFVLIIFFIRSLSKEGTMQ